MNAVHTRRLDQQVVGFIPAKATCPCCGHEFDTIVGSDGVTELNCPSCKSIIAVKSDGELDKIVSNTMGGPA